jgi:c(7)-type cytochrome triheme protein
VLLSGLTGDCAGSGDPSGFAGEAFRAGQSLHPPALELSQLPKDRFGLIDWADAIKSGMIRPRDSLDPKEPQVPPFDMDVVIYTKSSTQPDVIFPHKIHTMWLTCTNCHPAIFPMNAKEANKKMTMPAIAAGEFCGRCHDRIAFPLSDCLRCHVKPREVPPVDAEAERWGIQPLPEAQPASAPPAVGDRTVDVQPRVYSLNPCETRQFAAGVTMQSGGPPPERVRWESSDPKVARIDAKGVATGIAPGYTFVRAESGGVKSPPASLFVRDKGGVCGAAQEPAGGRSAAQTP